jgi:hypothetical protein
MRSCGKYDTARQAANGNIIRLMRYSCWVTKATNTLRIWNTYLFCTATTVARKQHRLLICLSCSFHLAKTCLIISINFVYFCRYYTVSGHPSTSTLVHLSVCSYHRCLQTYVIHFFFSEYLSLNTFSVLSDSSPTSPVAVDLEIGPSVSPSLHSISHSSYSRNSNYQRMSHSGV